MIELKQQLGVPIASGRTAEIYAWQEGQVLKLFHTWFELENIEHELRLARVIHASGLPVPAVGEIIRVNGRIGLVYQRVDGDTMWAWFSRKPWKLRDYARRMAKLHSNMHTGTLQADIPSQRQRLVNKIQLAESLPAPLRSKVKAALEILPDGGRLCHGDFFPGNIMMTEKDEVIIDWIDASKGNPLADVARTTIILLGAVETVQIRDGFQKILVRIFLKAYIHYYFKLKPGGEDEYKCWLPIVAAARLSENIPEVENWLIARAETIQ
jgi:Ser/Thr protein kinase RdoA (MazF antagonist)